MSKQRRYGIIGLLMAALILAGLGSRTHTAQAQDSTNLLTNGGLENPFYGQGGVSTRTAPSGWGLWVGSGSPDAFPHNDRVQVREGDVSWNLHQGYATFTAAGFQHVGGLKAGDTVRLVAYSWLYTCNDTTTSCVILDPPYRRSDTASGAMVKVGIDPTGGTDPNSSAIQWSAPSSPFDQWAELSVSATVQGDSVTVFLYMTQSVPMAINNVYWDQVSLVRTTEAVPTPEVVEVPFVVPQGVRPDGSIVHVVREGDTLSSIAFAYNKDYGTTVVSIAALNPGLKPNTRFLTIGQEIMILPPGSVDPVTGKLTAQSPNAASSPGLTPEATAVAAAASPTPTATLSQPSPTATQTVEPVVLTTMPAAASQAPTLTAEPPTPTATLEAAPATEPQAVAAAPASNLTAAEGTLCVSVYYDQNTNRVRDADEPLLAGAQVALSPPGGAETPYDVVDSAAPLCLEQPPGQYQVRVVLPPGYGATTIDAVTVSLVKGRQVAVAFGGAEGYAAPSSPVPEVVTGQPTGWGAVAPTAAAVGTEENQDKSTLDQIWKYSGLFVLGLTGVIVVTSIVLVLILRRPAR